MHMSACTRANSEVDGDGVQHFHPANREAHALMADEWAKMAQVGQNGYREQIQL